MSDVVLLDNIKSYVLMCIQEINEFTKNQVGKNGDFFFTQINQSLSYLQAFCTCLHQRGRSRQIIYKAIEQYDALKTAWFLKQKSFYIPVVYAEDPDWMREFLRK
jgi:hypothetical protein